MASSRLLRPRLIATLAAVLIVTGTTLSTTSVSSSATSRPTAIVAMGDSFASGEGAGSYEAATDRHGNYCHRSSASPINRTAIPGIDAKISLGCSGATTNHVKLGGAPRYGEAPQADRLRPIARDFQVKMIVLTVGLNNVGFANLVIDCIRAYLWLGPRCQESWANRLPTSLRETAPKIAENIADIRTVMREAGYADHDYQFVVQSYTSPFAAENRYWLSKVVQGCPIRNDDAKWGRDNAVPQITATIGQVAADAGVRFLDLGPSMHGREACANGVKSHAEEWANGIYIDVDQFKNGIGENLVSQGAHPNAQGYAQIARCLSDFYRIAARNGRCGRGSDGNLAVLGVPEAQPVTPRTFPKIEEPPPPEAQD